MKRAGDDKIVELTHPKGGAALWLYPTSRAQKSGQSTIKLVFDEANVEAFVKSSELKFGAIQKAEGFSFANAKDLDGNSLQVSDRALRMAS